MDNIEHKGNYWVGDNGRSLNSRPKCVHVGVDNDQHEGDDQVEDQPHVHHLDVRSHW